MYRQAIYDEPLLNAYSKKGRKGYSFPAPAGPAVKLPDSVRRETPPELPELSELQVVRHYTRLSQMNFGIESGFYPLGSCTMKYNPKINEAIAALPEVQHVHPDQREETVQGSLELMYNLQELLQQIAGMDAVSLQPAAGSNGEYAGMLMIKAYHEKRGDTKRTEIIVPDSAHGTNPASAAMCRFDVVEIPSTKEGTVDVEALKKAVSEKTAGLMLTNPNTLGIFESDIKEIAKTVHDAGGLLYYDGANLNANLGICTPGGLGFDVMHYNLHKTFTTPHGGGGPGAGPIACNEKLREFLPVPLVEKKGDAFTLNYDYPNTIGKVRAWYGNFGNLVRAYVYMLTMGKDLKTVAEIAVLNSNYMAKKLTTKFDMPGRELRKHEFVLSAEKIKRETGCTAGDVSKRLLDYGVHAPSNYFPQIVPEALMVEPTETESKEELDKFIDALLNVYDECYSNPDVVKNSPQVASVKRLDVVKGTREPVFNWRMIKND